MKQSFSSAVKTVAKYVDSGTRLRNSKLVVLAIQKLAIEDSWVNIQVISNKGIQISTGFRSSVIRSDKPYSTNTMLRLIATVLDEQG